MIKLTGLILIVLCCSMTGVFMASGLSRRVSAIEDAIALLDHLHDRLRYLQPTVGALIASARATPRLSGIGWLGDCSVAMGRGEDFSRAWRSALERGAGALDRDDTALLTPLADVLGATDLDSQLSALAYTREQMEQRHIQAREHREKHHKLYSTLGVLAGLGMAIILS